MPGMHSRTAGKSGNGRRGFILLRTLTAFMIALMMVPLCMRCISAMPYLFSQPEYVQDENTGVWSTDPGTATLTISGYIGAVSATGTYTMSGNEISADLVSDADGAKGTFALLLTREDGQIVLTLDFMGVATFWVPGQPETGRGSD